MNWGMMKRFCIFSAILWIGGGSLMNVIMMHDPDYPITVLQLKSMFVDGFGGMTIILGLTLLGRWVWLEVKSA